MFTPWASFWPRINAAGRIGGSGLGVKLLACCDAEEAAGLALRLDEMNQKRKQIEGIRIAAIDRAANQNDPVLVLHDTEWHEGVIGIVAGRVRERFGKPALIIALNEDGIGKGSEDLLRGFGSVVLSLLRIKPVFWRWRARYGGWFTVS